MLTVSRKVTEVNRRFHPEGKRFLITNYPKGKKYRRLKLSKQIIKKLEAYIKIEGLGVDDLLFARRGQARPPVKLHLAGESEGTWSHRA